MVRKIRPIIKRVFACALLSPALVTPILGQFVPGHVFVSVISGEGCFNGDFNGILEIDPTTGEVNVFADIDDGLCDVTGLTFTPNGDRLLAMNYGAWFEGDLGNIQSFAANGTSTILLDESDGLAGPSGFNGIAYDREGNLYVVTGDNEFIMRYAPDGTSEVFADAQDGVVFQGSIAIAPNGDVFFCSHRTDEVVRITPDGVGTLFDIPPNRPWAITVDRQGNLYVGSASTDIYRYEDAVAANREVLTPRFASVLRAIGLSLDQTILYVAASTIECGSKALIAIDIETRQNSLLACFISTSYGLAVHINYLADLDYDHDIDLQDFGIFSNFLLDLNGDSDGDVADLAVLVSTLTGP